MGSFFEQKILTYAELTGKSEFTGAMVHHFTYTG